MKTKALYHAVVVLLLTLSLGLGTLQASTVSPLITASKEGDLKTVNELLAQGVDVNAQDTHGETALIVASRKGLTGIVKVLLKKGADVNAQNEGGGTALMAASYFGHTEVAKALLAKGANVNTQTKDGRTALMVASGKGHTGTVKVLLEKGADASGGYKVTDLPFSRLLFFSKRETFVQKSAMDAISGKIIWVPLCSGISLAGSLSLSGIEIPLKSTALTSDCMIKTRDYGDLLIGLTDRGYNILVTSKQEEFFKKLLYNASTGLNGE